jgi:hypothetical protein
MSKPNHYSFDIYRVYVENEKELVSLEIDNVISWDSFKLKMTKEEFEKFVLFVQGYLK